ncbi:MAG: hypothetical protein ACOYM2_15880 [Rectinemataceae bacterium]
MTIHGKCDLISSCAKRSCLALAAFSHALGFPGLQFGRYEILAEAFNTLDGEGLPSYGASRSFHFSTAGRLGRTRQAEPAKQNPLISRFLA